MFIITFSKNIYTFPSIFDNEYPSKHTKPTLNDDGQRVTP